MFMGIGGHGSNAPFISIYGLNSSEQHVRKNCEKMTNMEMLNGILLCDCSDNLHVEHTHTSRIP